MNTILVLAILRILLCGYGAFLMLEARRPVAWAAFLLMIATNFIIHFHQIDPLTLELLRSVTTIAIFLAIIRRR